MVFKLSSVVRCTYVNNQRMVFRLTNTSEVQEQQVRYVAYLLVRSFCKRLLGTFFFFFSWALFIEESVYFQDFFRVRLSFQS